MGHIKSTTELSRRNLNNSTAVGAVHGIANKGLEKMKKFGVGVVSAILFLSVVVAQGTPLAVTKGKKVSMEYTLTVEGKVVDSSEGKAPLSFVQGTGQIISGLERQLEGLVVGDEKIVVVSPKEGYGEINPEAYREVPKTSLPPQMQPQVGMILQMSSPDGQRYPALVREVKADSIIVDFNHPLAGKVLNFKIKIVSIE